MARKYDAIDEKLLQWFRESPGQVTTADAIQALGITCETTQRHISRRFTLLEDKGALQCTLFGTTRICTVFPEKLPDVLHRGGLNNKTWRSHIRREVDKKELKQVLPAAPKNSIPAADSSEYEAAGGIIEKLPSHWDALGPSKRVGPSTFLDYADEQD